MTTGRFELLARVLVAGSAEGPALRLDEPLSFWGGFDPSNGEIIDAHHPQCGQRVGGTVLFIPASRGSAGTPAGIAESLRRGSGPMALVLGQSDVNIGIGALVANRLYGLSVPVLELPAEMLRRIDSGRRVSIDASGLLVAAA
jgi:predicted aconitase with swiveling domain